LIVAGSLQKQRRNKIRRVGLFIYLFVTVRHFPTIKVCCAAPSLGMHDHQPSRDDEIFKLYIAAALIIFLVVLCFLLIEQAA
jgi:hypothetical protein